MENLPNVVEVSVLPGAGGDEDEGEDRRDTEHKAQRPTAVQNSFKYFVKYLS